MSTTTKHVEALKVDGANQRQQELEAEILAAEGGKHANLSRKAAAMYSGVCVRTLDYLKEDGKGPPYLCHGRRILYPFTDLKAWHAARISHERPLDKERHDAEMKAYDLYRKIKETEADLNHLRRLWRELP